MDSALMLSTSLNRSLSITGTTATIILIRTVNDITI